jgi:hypothetical protein
VLAQGELIEEDAINIQQYRHHIASESCRKSWLRKHKNVKSEVLL